MNVVEAKFSCPTIILRLAIHKQQRDKIPVPHQDVRDVIREFSDLAIHVGCECSM